MKNKKQFTLIELIIVIVVIGILAAMALPKFNGVVRDAKISAMINDKEALEKALVLYYQKYDELPLLNEEQELIVQKEGISSSKIVLAEEVKSSDMETIYKSLQETLTYYSDSEDSLYRIDLTKVKDSLSKNIKYGHKKNDKDFYVYSLKTGNVYYYDYLVNGNGTIQHNEYDTLLNNNELVTKTISPSISDSETVINNKPIIELITNLENIDSNTIIDWQYKYTDTEETPTKISFILNDTEYDSFDKIPTTLNEGEYTIKLKAQNNKGIWSNEIIKSFIVEKNTTTITQNYISLGEQHSMKIGEDGNLYAWGNNSKGQLGIGNTTNQTTPQLITLPNGEMPISIALGYSHSMVITDVGNLYAWGYNNCGQLGIGNTIDQTTPQLVILPNGEKPISIALGESHSMVITDKENLYSWGRNTYGQLGIGNKENQTTPQLVTFFNEEKPTFIALGYYHSMAITDKGNLYSWGWNFSGQLGIGNKTDETTPKLVKFSNEEKPTFIALGYYHSMTITDKGNLYAWGRNDYGQLGIKEALSQKTPQLIPMPNEEKPISISVGYLHSMAITDKGNLYSWGRNTYGQLGIGNKESQTTPQLVTLPNGEKPVSIVSGSYHSMAITNTENIYVWGENSYGQLGIGNVTNQLTPIKIDLP